jgi:protein SCO1/2
MNRRALLRLLAAALISLAGCGGPSRPSFKATDITGAAFGRHLELTDHTGKPRNLDAFKGKVIVVFFGYTQIPDVCTTTLATLREVREKLGADGTRLQVLFVTVDPERDTQQVLAQYVPLFDPDFLGLYGDLEATARAAKEFKILYNKNPGKTPASYTVDHSAGVFVFDTQGRIRLYGSHGYTADSYLHDIRMLLAESK